MFKWRWWTTFRGWHVTTGPKNQSYVTGCGRGPRVCRFITQRARFRRDWPHLTWGGRDLRLAFAPANLTCWHPEVLQPRPAYRSSCGSHLERVLLTVSKWEQAVGRGSSKEEGGGLHRDFLLLSPVTSCQFTPQCIWNQNLIKILNK